MSNFFVGLFSSLLFFCVLLIIEFITRKNNCPKELTRRLAHLLSGLFGILMGFVLDSWVFITFAIAFLGIISISYSIKFLTSIHGVKRKTYGELLLPLGVLSAYLISGATTSFVVAVLILSVSDSLAGIIGDLKLFDKGRWTGSAFFLISALLILVFFFYGQQVLLLLAIAFAVTIVERFSKYGTDNLTIPLSTSLLLKVFLQI
ncbi:MAG: hypothetical protein UT00_C0013G0006 [Parcubacteria group bacterium GW2011_GWA1_38_7]|nr:MAG: hypothetical protein UT00_C0013G0006 [Parcubacteria group bacterium GW2011_GWA1_38_7]